MRVRRLGLDLGSMTTRIALAPADGERGPRLISVPTAIGYSHRQAEPIRFSCIGERALARRDHLRLVRPLDSPEEELGSVLRDYARKLRYLYQKRSKAAVWGVVSSSPADRELERDAKRAVANELFDRVAFVDGMFLSAVAIASRDVRQHSILIDIGQRSIRAALMHGVAPTPEEFVEVPFASDRVNAVYRSALGRRYPELVLTDPTLESMKGRFSFVAPARQTCRLEIKYRGAAKTVDVSDIVEEASAALLRPLLRAAREVLALCPSDDTEAFQKNIVLVGGGARMLGLAPRTEADLRLDGFDFVQVRAAENPGFVAARGAYLWAESLRDEDWSIPLFSFAN